ncbi:MAG TPA: tetratricopeptide repeat protein [Vicinamibacteria bacterium]|nr:tetratricopeptide repeat protein [Vicinamibacteria bacterium]
MLHPHIGVFLALSLALPAAPKASRAVTPTTQDDAAASDAAFARGVALHQAGDVVGAIQAYEAALKLVPGRVEVLSNLGAALSHLGRYDEAVQRYRQALEADPHQASVRLNLGLALYKGGRAQEASAEFRKVLERDASQKAALLLLADCELQMGNDRKVIELLSPRERALGDDRLFAYLLGTALIRQGELQHGQALVDRLFRSGDSAEGHLLLGAQHIRREDYRPAVPELKRAAELNPELPTVHSLLGIALMNTGERPAAIPEFQRELSKNPNDFEANLRLGLLLRDEERLQEAAACIEKAARLRPRHPDVLYALGRIDLASDHLSQAQAHLEELTRVAPEFEGGHVLLATVYYRLKNKEAGDRERAVVDRLKAARKASEGAAGEAADAKPPGQPN